MHQDTLARPRAAFTARNLFKMSHAYDFTSWVYRHDGDLAETDAPRWWENSSDMIADGDMVTITARDTGGIRFAAHMWGRIEMRRAG